MLRCFVCFRDPWSTVFGSVIHASEKRWENGPGFSVECTVLWSRAMRRPYHNNDKRALRVKRPSSRVWKGSVRLQRKKPVEEIQQSRRKGSSQIHPEPVFPRVCQHETAVRRGLYLTNALYYSGASWKKPCLCAAGWKRSGLDPPSSEQIRTLWAVTHLQPPHFSLKPCEWLSTPIKHGNRSTASDAAPRDQKSLGFWRPARGFSLRASSRAPWWSVNKHV